MSKKAFNGSRLKFARKRRGFTIKELSEHIGITTKAYSNYENDKSVPRPQSLDLLSKILSFPLGFFFLDEIEPLRESNVSFRSFARMSAKIRDKALHSGQIALEFSSWIDQRFDLPKSELFDLKNYMPEAAADALRNEWGIGERPIKDMVHLLEAKGVRVFSLAEETSDLDAFSFWVDKTPFVFLNTRKSVERSRFDAAHELGHLVLHRQDSPCGKEAENEANSFASAFLMSQGSVIARSSRFATLNWLIASKAYWRVSAAALVRRLRDLRLITEWQYRSLTVELSKRGYMKNEPQPIKQRELSKLFPMVFQALREEGIGVNKIAEELGVYPDDLNTLLFNLTITARHGGNKKASGANKGRAVLRVVK